MTLKLWRVTVSQTYISEQVALVYAPSAAAAEDAALQEADFTSVDVEEYGGAEARCWPITPDDIPLLTANQFHFCLMPPPPGEGQTYWQEIDFLDLMQMITPSQVEDWRLERIERNNGQIPLLEVQP